MPGRDAREKTYGIHRFEVALSSTLHGWERKAPNRGVVFDPSPVPSRKGRGEMGTHPAIAALFPCGGRVFLRGRERLFSFTLADARR
jgi:hypothetical protein